MPWEKQFDEEEVLSKVMQEFWSKGYAATSMRDLVRVTGVNRASLYATFSDKHSLFLAALRHYDDKVRRQMLTNLMTKDEPRNAIRSVPYASTAQMEYESVAPGPFDIVELNHIREMYTLVDFDAVVRELDILLFPESLSARVNSSPVFGAWKYQPFPLASQLLGNWLRLHASSKFDGLFFRSTKDPHGTNFFIFAPSDWVIA